MSGMTESERLRPEPSQSEADARWLAAALDGLTDAIVLCDGEGDVVFLNRAGEQLTGWSKQHAEGAPLGEVAPLWDGLEGNQLPFARLQEAVADPARPLAQRWLLRPRAPGRPCRLDVSVSQASVSEQERGVLVRLRPPAGSGAIARLTAARNELRALVRQARRDGQS